MCSNLLDFRHQKHLEVNVNHIEKPKVLDQPILTTKTPQMQQQGKKLNTAEKKTPKSVNERQKASKRAITSLDNGEKQLTKKLKLKLKKFS